MNNHLIFLVFYMDCNDIEKLFSLISQEELQLTSYSSSCLLYNSEAYLSLWELRNLLKNPPEKLTSLGIGFLEERWKSLLNRNCQYLHDFNNPANNICIALAKLIAKETGKNFLCLLMPSLGCVAPEEYISSSYTDDDLILQENILSDDNQRLICIPDVFEFAQEDGILLHNSLFNKKGKVLSVSESERLMSRQPSVKVALESLRARALYKLEGETVGAAVTRLIQGLRNGGMHARLKPYESKILNGTDLNSGMDANVAIVVFAEYLNTLDPETYETLMSAFKMDRYYSQFVEKRTFKDTWERLIKPVRPKQQDSLYCVEMIANTLEEILKANTSLYDLVSYQGGAIDNLTQLNTNYLENSQKMKRDLVNLSTHYCYPTEDSSLSHCILDKFIKNNIPLRASDIRLFIGMLESSSCEQFSAKIIRLFNSNPCSSLELSKLEKEEIKIFQEFHHQSEKRSASSLTIFNKNKRKLPIDSNLRANKTISL